MLLKLVHFVGGHCKTIHGIDTDTIEQGQFTKFHNKRWYYGVNT